MVQRGWLAVPVPVSVHRLFACATWSVKSADAEADGEAEGANDANPMIASRLSTQ